VSYDTAIDASNIHDSFVGVPTFYGSDYNLYYIESWYGSATSGSDVTYILKAEDANGQVSVVTQWLHGAGAERATHQITPTNVTTKKLWLEIDGEGPVEALGFSATLTFINSDSQCALT